MLWSYANIDWNGTGAMVQAIGSVAAIAAAIWIDQGAARRLRAEGEKERQEARRARLAAVYGCHAALARCADKIDAVMPREGSAHLPEPIQSDLKGAISTIDYYLRIPEPLTVNLVGALGQTEHAMTRYRRPEAIVMFDVTERDQWTAKFREDAASIATFYERAKRD